MHVNVTLSGGSKGGWGRAPGPISFNFMQFSGENGQNDKKVCVLKCSLNLQQQFGDR